MRCMQRSQCQPSKALGRDGAGGHRRVCRHGAAGAALALDGFAGLTDEVKDASSLTEAANVVWYDKLDFEDRSEYENATRNLIAAPDALEICDDAGRVIWSQKAYTFVEGADAPASANPSLWENTRNNHVYGLFKVIDGIYQVRGYDMANLTLIEGQTGWIVIDTLMSVECTRAAIALVEEHLGKRPVKAVIIGHPHIDHYGGIKGVVSEEEAAKASMSLEEQLAGDKVPIIVPEHFEEHAVSENSYAGRAMGAELILDYLGIALDKTALADRDFKVNVTCTDTGQTFMLRFKNGPMLHMETAPVDDALLTFAGPKSGLLTLMGAMRPPCAPFSRLQATRSCLTNFAAASQPSTVPGCSTS